MIPKTSELSGQLGRDNSNAGEAQSFNHVHHRRLEPVSRIAKAKASVSKKVRARAISAPGLESALHFATISGTGEERMSPSSQKLKYSPIIEVKER